MLSHYISYYLNVVFNEVVTLLKIRNFHQVQAISTIVYYLASKTYWRQCFLPQIQA